MSETDARRPSLVALLNGLAEKASAFLAPIASPYFPEHYYAIYRRNLSSSVRQLAVLDGLPSSTMEEGYQSLLLDAGDGRDPLDAWGVLSQSSRLIVTGCVGSGKSTLLRALAWQFASQLDQTSVQWLSFKLFGDTANEMPPVLVDVRDLSPRSLLDLMSASLAVHGFPKATDYLRRRLREGHCVVLVDGLTGAAGPLTQALTMAAEYPQNVWVLATRDVGDVAVPDGFARYHLEGMAAGAVERFVGHNLGERSATARGLLAVVQRNDALAELARAPLMLAAMCRALRSSRPSQVPLTLVVQACLDVLLSGWPSVSTAAPDSDVAKVLKELSFELKSVGRDTLRTGDVQAWLCVDEATRDALLEQLVTRTGVLCQDGDGCYSSWSPLLISYCAAMYMVECGRERDILDVANDSGWHDTVVLVCGLTSEPMALELSLEEAAITEPYKWFLLAHCIAETMEPDPELVRRVEDRLYDMLERDDGDAVWRPAAIALAGMSGHQVQDHFVALCREPHDADTRRRAVLVLGRLAERWAIPSLGGAISDSDAGVREQAAWALGFVPSRHAVRVLPRALRSAVPGVRKAAATSLARLGKSGELTGSVVSELIGALRTDRDLARETADIAEGSLVELGSEALPHLVNALGDRRLHASQRGRVARALGRLGDDRALPVLVDALLTESSEDVAGYIGAVSQIGAGAVPALIETLAGRDITASGALIECLARIGAPAVGPLVEAIAGSAPEVRRSAVRALGLIGAPAIKPLTHALLHDARFEVRRRALEILGSIGEADAVASLIEALQDDDEGVRLNAARYLGSLASADAVEPLVALLERETQPVLMRQAVTSLGEIKDERAIEAILTALDQPALRDAASTALVDFGAAAVEPVVAALHSVKSHAEARQSLWDILVAIGAHGRADDQTAEGLARAYSSLRDGDQSPAEILSTVEKLQWWKHGAELYRTLQVAHVRAQASSIRDLGEVEPLLSWLTEDRDWLRPQVKSILWGLEDVVQSINLFSKQVRRDSQRDALLSAIDKLEEIREIARNATLPFEQVFLDGVISRWHSLILDATKQLRGRASLLIRLLTPRLPLRENQSIAMTVFSLFNEGDSAARNLSVTLRPVDLHSNGVSVVRGESLNLDPLGIGEERQVEVGIAPKGARLAELVFEARYDDDERQGVTDRYSCHIEFYVAPSTYIEIDRSPYVVGMPVKSSEMFFGRQDVFEWVRENISGRHQEQPLLLFGERRMGKTSVLYQLMDNPPTPNHICLLFDLQLYGYASTVSELLYELASSMVQSLQGRGIDLEEPDWSRYEGNPHRAFLAFCDALEARLGDHRIVIMMDEFGVLMAKVRDGAFDASFFDYLRGIAQRSSKFTFLFTGAYEVRRMQQDFESILFNMPKVRKISYLTEAEATSLIVKPMANLITYHPLVVQKIRSVTACHPYFTQYICDELVKLARKERRNIVELTDLDLVIQSVVQDATGNIENSIYNYLSREEKTVLAALASVTDDVRVFVPLGDIAGEMERRGLSMPREDVLQALKALRERDLVTEMRIGQQLRYSFRMGLVRMWLRQNEILLRLGQEREL